MPNGDSMWTSSLLYVLTGLGIEEQTARQAIARLGRRLDHRPARRPRSAVDADAR
ncbi:hypothetical protein FCI23_33285 [Actinacidiphila oryziradicis]|uniref:Uncharacterized protein n=1 Tax=Actinacidiphila oryziradicis TaxID=2571141 RepID=A0A4U0S7F2_9ACTN|nr:hypothetical protein FCI23_33285 [Actinacidiphila oryziradicis]